MSTIAAVVVITLLWHVSPCSRQSLPPTTTFPLATANNSCGSNSFGFSFPASQPAVLVFCCCLRLMLTLFASQLFCLCLQFFHFPFYFLKWLSVCIWPLYVCVCVTSILCFLWVGPAGSIAVHPQNALRQHTDSLFLRASPLCLLVAVCLNELPFLPHVSHTLHTDLPVYIILYLLL